MFFEIITKRREQTTKNKSPPIQRAARDPKRARRGRDDNSLCKCSVYLCTVQTKKHAKGVAPEKHAKNIARNACFCFFCVVFVAIIL